MEKKDVQLPYRLSKEMREALKKKARSENRTVADVLDKFLARYTGHKNMR